MFFKKDERDQTANRLAMRYTCCFEAVLISILWIISTTFKNFILLAPLHLFGSSIYVSFSSNSNIAIIASTEILVMFAAQAIINKRLGGTTEPITSGSNKFRFMDERERIVTDKALFITYLYVNIFLIILTIIDIVISGKLGLPLIIIALQLIFYSITKVILLNHYGENIS
ncbi:hypothetical protein [Clostridium sp.]|jgi:hypothetical protein|uniref:hypothetical protein n=1 Tax=Clostridium sp. TaxID=1506 RepID=UPI003EEA0D69